MCVRVSAYFRWEAFNADEWVTLRGACRASVDIDGLGGESRAKPEVHPVAKKVKMVRFSRPGCVRMGRRTCRARILLGGRCWWGRGTVRRLKGGMVGEGGGKA